ncbi:hypothetical protein N7481_003229 [Penicillium waksmanii]|uniref:uncharacterized protein n=1 Tax=Penicillium waksmanii TaxID=69791 RepID=UPI0025473571|nr:uncharacterized protein N7481_003229 [Penicillium waksmanii]KAJ5988019.1 hypothetical protein N7481_003229 [Penicillium waksmanii]
MSPGKVSSENGQWLARRYEYGQEHLEWEEFYFKNKASVPTLVGNVKSLREIMLNVKMGGQNKAVPINKGLVVNDQVISSEDGVETKLRIYTPYPPSEGLPIMIYFHGGGWALGDLEGEDRTCRGICVSTRMVVVGVNYRLAPEHPYPAALNDAWATLEWVLANQVTHKANVNKILVGGTSAGANLAAVICHQAKARGVTISGQLLRIPIVCQSTPHYRDLGLESMNYYHDTPILCRQSMVQFLEWYSPPDAADMSVSPLLAMDFTDLPPAYIQVCGRDPLRDEGLAYADKLEEYGVPVRVNVYQGLPHAFWIFPEISTSGQAAQELLDGIDWLLKEISD